jgi:hypothetical protein
MALTANDNSSNHRPKQHSTGVANNAVIFIMILPVLLTAK